MATTMSIDSSLYEAARLYGTLHDISVREMVESLLKKFLPQPSVAKTKIKEQEEAMAFVKSLSLQGKHSVPENERGIEALIETKYI